MSSLVHWISWEHVTNVLGVLGFLISSGHVVLSARNQTINPQPPLLAELRRYLDDVYESCRQVCVNLNLDSHMIRTNVRPNIPRRPENGFADAIERMPELGKTITSVGQLQIDLLHRIVETADYHWKTLQSCIDADPINVNALDFAAKLKNNCRIIERFFPEYIDALIEINKKGNLWKRYRYRDHGPFTYKLFRWTPLQRAVSEYERTLMKS